MQAGPGAARSAAHGARVRQHTRARDGLRWPPWASGASSTACAGGVCGDCTRTRGRRDDPGELASGPAAPRRGVRRGPLPGVKCRISVTCARRLLKFVLGTRGAVTIVRRWLARRGARVGAAGAGCPLADGPCVAAITVTKPYSKVATSPYELTDHLHRYHRRTIPSERSVEGRLCGSRRRLGLEWAF
ncbi:hypothetical protein EVAR_38313_1 [Eumeta japonica]|uniref:Uncharacterized protein n=1 Tax=Eumeta variegata TaxID=151549 RepID=A0A4C1W7Z9_EUMVA|nr:hypothetical protein EVAR_38313_1 [Eumeta japonica]